jgi:hypothetical protein
MSGGEACRQIEESAWEAESPVPESATRLRRASAETMPTSDSFTGVHATRPDWAVDLGEVMLSMTTFELWSAIERSEVPPWVRVWREGLECWTPVAELPELRWAVLSAPEFPREEGLEAAPEPTPADAESEPLAQPATTPAPAPLPEARASAADLPARAVSRQVSTESAPTEETPAPLTQAPAPREGTRWLFAGSAVAAIAIAAAVFRVTAPTAMAPAASLPAAQGAAAAVEAQPSPMDAPAAAAPSLADVEPAAVPVVRRGERGQTRQPRGGRRAQGR